MGKIEIGGQSFDPGNITGAKLAEIGKWALTGKKIIEQKEKEIDDKLHARLGRAGDYTNIGWLNMRVDEVCQKGKL